MTREPEGQSGWGRDDSPSPMQAAKKRGSSGEGRRKGTPRQPKATGTGGSGTSSGGGQSGSGGSGGKPPPSTPPGGPPAGPGGGGYQRTNNIPDAEAFVRSLGVGFVQYTDSDPAANDPAVIHEIANNTNEALAFLLARGVLEAPRRFETCRLFFTEAGRRATGWAAYVQNPMALTGLSSNWMRLNRAILTNPRPDWPNVVRIVEAMHQAGEISTSDPHHFVYHEFGHFLWGEDNSGRNQRADNQTFQAALPNIRRQISMRARLSVSEFVSEVFAQKLVAVVPVHPDVELLYRQLGGRAI